MNRIYILLGANLGKPLDQLSHALLLLQERMGHLISVSSIYESEAWGVEDQPMFYNQALVIDTKRDKQQCLTICQQIENELGRIRVTKWGARIIDIDILYFNNEVYESETLVIPHPLVQLRNFVLVPLVEIAGEYIHPKFLRSNSELLSDSKDKLIVSKLISES